ncbi:MAG: hypothetical protein WBO36_05090 [Saprospiraceae bacterium]
MSTNHTKLYDAFGELLYVLVKADGEFQDAERDTLQQILSYHPWAKEILWSFNYEEKKNHDIEDLYKKVILACIDIGPNAEYQSMIEVLEAVAESSLGIVKEEQKIIDNFKQDLLHDFGNR